MGVPLPSCYSCGDWQCDRPVVRGGGTQQTDNHNSLPWTLAGHWLVIDVGIDVITYLALYPNTTLATDQAKRAVKGSSVRASKCILTHVNLYLSFFLDA